VPVRSESSRCQGSGEQLGARMATLSIGDGALYFREAGSGSPLLLIHGVGAHAHLFDAAVPLLAEHHRVISYDRRGYPRSGSQPAAIRGYLERQAADAAALLRKLGAVPATLVGWSMGAVIALRAALDYPELVSRLVLCEPPLHATKHMPLENLGPFLRARFLSAIGRKRQAAATFFRMSLAQPSGTNGYDSLDDATREGILANAEMLIHELKTGTGEELTAQRLQQLQCPISAIVGDDTGAVFSAATDRLSKILPQMPIRRVPGAGHLVVMTHPKDFARLVLYA
jgi:pimeloyl-ACP methyl ester carboxylesterase